MDRRRRNTGVSRSARAPAREAAKLVLEVVFCLTESADEFIRLGVSVNAAAKKHSRGEGKQNSDGSAKEDSQEHAAHAPSWLGSTWNRWRLEHRDHRRVANFADSRLLER